MASHPTAWRVVSPGWAGDALEDARRVARAAAWSAGAASETSTLDFDATLVTANSDKEDAAPNYKHGFGFHPMLVFLDEIEEALAGLLRPGNAGANDAADHVVVLERALAQLRAQWRLGHEEGDNPSAVVHPIVVRADSAGASHWFVEHCTDRAFICIQRSWPWSTDLSEAFRTIWRLIPVPPRC